MRLLPYLAQSAVAHGAEALSGLDPLSFGHGGGVLEVGVEAAAAVGMAQRDDGAEHIVAANALHSAGAGGADFSPGRGQDVNAFMDAPVLHRRIIDQALAAVRTAQFAAATAVAAVAPMIPNLGISRKLKMILMDADSKVESITLTLFFNAP